MAIANGFSIHVPTGQLRDAQLQQVLYGTGDQNIYRTTGRWAKFDTTFEGVIPNLELRYKETESDFIVVTSKSLCKNIHAMPVVVSA